MKGADFEWHLNTRLKKSGIQTPFRFQTSIQKGFVTWLVGHHYWKIGNPVLGWYVTEFTIWNLYHRCLKKTKHSKSGHLCPVIEWLTHSKSDLQNVRILNDSGFRMVRFRIPTVFGFLNIFHVTYSGDLKSEQVWRFLMVQKSLVGKCYL